ncbi:hypothetical protein HMI51_06225 [Corallococcus coralloides]|nr:hypothetical protein [Corallococcus coralloides]
MALYEVSGGSLKKVESVSFAREGVRERQDLQKWLRDEPEALGEELLIVAEEFGDWEDSRRRIDLLALDRSANLVVIELKRTEDGGHMELQAIRYAAMVSSMTFEDVVRVHEDYLQQQGSDQSARARIAAFLNTSPEEPAELSNSPRIILVSQDFSREVTTTVLWLVERGLDLTCIQVLPYKVEGRMFLELRQVLPLEEASDYQVRLRRKDEAVRKNAVQSERRELTLKALARHGRIGAGTLLEVVKSARPETGSKAAATTFQARVGEIEDGKPVRLIWELDGQAYSASRLTHMLRDEHGMKWLGNNIFIHWQVAGGVSSMWNMAEELTRGERFVGNVG